MWILLKTLFHIKWKSQPRNLPFYISGIALLSTFLYFSQVRSEIIATYALCGFANLSSIGIQLGALGPMAPSRRGDLAQIVLRALLGGIVTSLMTACIAGKNLSLSISFPISLNKIFPDCCVSVQEPCIMIHPWTRIWLFRPYMSCQCISMVTPESSFSFIKALYPVLKYWKLNKFSCIWKLEKLQPLNLCKWLDLALYHWNMACSIGLLVAEPITQLACLNSTVVSTTMVPPATNLTSTLTFVSQFIRQTTASVW